MNAMRGHPKETKNGGFARDGRVDVVAIRFGRYQGAA
jgi:hypothetical protein